LNNTTPEYLPYYRSVAEADLGLDALYAAREKEARPNADSAKEASLPYELILPPGAMTKQGGQPKAEPPKPVTPWREQLKAARNFEDIKRALWLGLYHDYPQTRFQRISSKILRKIREATR